MIPKFKKGDKVTLSRVFTAKLTLDGTNYDYSHGIITVEVIRSQKTSMGYCYELRHDSIDLGGVMYWEDDVQSLDVGLNTDEDDFWKMWGDR